jgi:hypothetical protein
VPALASRVITLAPNVASVVVLAARPRHSAVMGHATPVTAPPPPAIAPALVWSATFTMSRRCSSGSDARCLLPTCVQAGGGGSARGAGRTRIGRECVAEGLRCCWSQRGCDSGGIGGRGEPRCARGTARPGRTWPHATAEGVAAGGPPPGLRGRGRQGRLKRWCERLRGGGGGGGGRGGGGGARGAVYPPPPPPPPGCTHRTLPPPSASSSRAPVAPPPRGPPWCPRANDCADGGRTTQ